MSDNYDPIQRTSARSYDIDKGLRTHMLRVYSIMAMGLTITGGFAYFVSQSVTLMNIIFGSPLMYVFIFAPLAMVFYLSARINKMSASTAYGTFMVYSALVGISIASIFIIYTGTSIFKVFFITAGMFLGTSLYGYTTNTDLSRFGGFLFMGVIGIIIACVVNMFMQSSALDFAISIFTVLIFTGLTAYDTQMIKELYYEADSHETTMKKSIIGALKLYLSFLNMFLALLNLFGDRR